MIMASYCYAAIIPRDLARTVRIIGSYTPARTIYDAEGNGSFIEGHRDDIELVLEPES